MSKDYRHALVSRPDYDPVQKKAFHNACKTLLRRLAIRLDQTGGPSTSSGYGERDPIRSNMGGIAVSGEITLHYDRLYVQAQHGFGGPATGLMYRACKSRTDYSGGQNHFTTLEALLDTESLARLIESKVPFIFAIPENSK